MGALSWDTGLQVGPAIRLFLLLLFSMSSLTDSAQMISCFLKTNLQTLLIYLARWETGRTDTWETERTDTRGTERTETRGTERTDIR